MPFYIYRAKAGPGREVSGRISAESRAGAVAGIGNLGYTAVEVTLEEDVARGDTTKGMPGKISRRDLSVFTRQMASMARTGVPLLKALDIASEQSGRQKMRSVAAALSTSIRDGSTLSGSMARHPGVFPPVYVSMVRSGESAGRLDTVLEHMADALDKEEEMRMKIRAAAAYPLLTLAVGALTVFILMSFFLPKVADLYSGYRNLPLPTRMLMSVSGFFEDYHVWILGIVAIAALAAGGAGKSRSGRVFIDSVALALPVASRFILYAELSRFARTLGLLLDSGIAIDKAMALGRDVVKNTVLSAEIEILRADYVVQGGTLSQGMSHASHFPRFVTGMVSVGEQSGHLEDALREIAAYYDGELEQMGRLVSSLIEPVLILFVGGIVGLIVAAMLLPVFQLGGLL